MRAWLSDLILRAAYEWGGLNAIALLTCLVLAVTLRCIYRRLTVDGAHWMLAAFATYLAAMGMSPSFVARPNVVSFLGVWLVADICQRFHASTYDRSKLWWLVPIMLLWTNMHGGFLAGLVLIAIAWAVEALLAAASWDASIRSAARSRLLPLTAVGAVAGIATLINPNGIGLHLWSLSAVTDPFIQNHTTTEWLPPNFTDVGWFNIERLILFLPLLAVTCRRRCNWVGLAMTVVWLHFALTSRRYSTLWVVIATPTLCELMVGNGWLQEAAHRLKSLLSEDLQPALTACAEASIGSPSYASWLFAVSMLTMVPVLPDFAAHNSEHLPASSLDQFLERSDSERTFHSINWGGYLTWHGWDNHSRFRPWIDDRIDVHGTEHTKRYFQVMNAEPGWQKLLDSTQVEAVCVPPTSRLAYELTAHPSCWRLDFQDEHLVVYRRKDKAVAAHR